MNYQSLLSAILESKYYTQCNNLNMLEDIRELCITLQRNSGLKIIRSKVPQMQLKQYSSQIFLSCPQRQSQGCLFSYIFKIVDIQKNINKYELTNCNQNHSKECLASRSLKKQDKTSLNIQIPTKQIILNKSIDLTSPTVRSIQSQQTLTASPLSKQAIIVNHNLQKKVYSEDQFSLLKKELELDCKGLLSKSTQFENQEETSVIKKVNFHCKYQNSCPYQAVLSLVQESQEKKQKEKKKRLYSLQLINPHHLPQCILDKQIINYNENTMKIDKQLSVLTKIIENSSLEIKPKEILKKLSDQLGQSEQFIYEGLQKKINRRAIKKYFDNCVAKVRNKLFPNLKLNSHSSNSPIIKQNKKDDDYICRSIDKI